MLNFLLLFSNAIMSSGQVLCCFVLQNMNFVHTFSVVSSVVCKFDNSVFEHFSKLVFFVFFWVHIIMVSHFIMLILKKNVFLFSCVF